MNIADLPYFGVLGVPLVAAATLAGISGYRTSARLNAVAAFLTLIGAVSLFFVRPDPGVLLFVDDLNVVFIVVNAFVGFTTSLFSASYIRHEIESGRLTKNHIRFYHAMFQAMMFGMNLALSSNNIGLMWVAVELATLTTVVMVGLYRTHRALEAAQPVLWLVRTHVIIVAQRDGLVNVWPGRHVEGERHRPALP